MKKIVILASIAASLVASAASANNYVDPRAKFSGERFFATQPFNGQ